MKKTVLLLVSFLPVVLFAQIRLTFPADFTSAHVGQEVEIVNPLVVTNTYNVEKYGGIYLSSERLRIPTDGQAPGKEMFTQANKTNAANQLLLKAGIYSYIDADGSCRTGRQVTNIVGTLTYESGKYTITPTREPVFAGNERLADARQLITTSYNVKVASFNVENYGQTDAALPTKRTKVTAALKAMDADIYALAEVFGDAALKDLCASLNNAMNTDRYKYIANIASKTLMCSFIYDSEKVMPHKELKKNTFVPVSSTNQSAYLPERKVAQAFDHLQTGERFIVSLNHWKSKSGSASGQEDKFDGQGTYNPRRVQEAEATIRFINELISYYEDPDVLIVGDLNAYTSEDPISILLDGGMVNLLARYAPQEYSYSYYTNGYSGVGYLDHALATSTMSSQVTFATPFHINADEPAYLDTDTDMYKSSDHDPIITAINLGMGTGITPSEKEKNEVIIYGDSRQGYLTLQAGSDISRVEIYSINGQAVSSHTPGAPGRYMVLPVADLPNGFYLLRVYNGTSVTTHKLILP